jgi:hypothetical protein
MPHISYGLDSRGRIVRIESGITRANIRRLPSLEEALRRLSTNLRSDRQTTDPNNGNVHQVTYFCLIKEFISYLCLFYYRGI